jgi:nitroreductase
MKVLRAIKTMRAVRQFINKNVDDEVIVQILEAGRWAGSGKNVQPWRFVILKDRRTMERLAECGKYASHLREAAFAIVLVSPPVPRVEFDCGRAAQNMMLAAWSFGVGSCLASMHEENEAKGVLDIPIRMKLQQVIAFGYPRLDVTPTIEGKPLRQVLVSVGRKPLSEMVCYEKWRD